MQLNKISTKLMETVREEGAKVLETWISEKNNKGRAVLSIDGAVSNWYFCTHRDYWTRAGF